MTNFYLDYRGSDYNGGGYDSTITGATVNLASGQYAALTASGLECSAGSTTVTSIHGGFTSDMIGNYINIYNGYEYTFNCYAISGVPSSTSLELESSPSPSLSAVSGIGKIGGAWRTCDNFATGGGVLNWSGKIKVPQAGDTVKIRGNGQHNPPSGQYTGLAYINVAGGNYDNPVYYTGYNGRPAFIPITSNLFWHSSPVAFVENIKFHGGKGGWETSLCQINGGLFIRNCIFDQCGSRARAFQGVGLLGNYIYNSKLDEANQSLGTSSLLDIGSYGNICSHNVIENAVGLGISIGSAFCENNVINNLKGTGINLTDIGGHTNQMRFNTINRCSGAGIRRSGQGRNMAIGNLITNCSGVAIYETNALYSNDRRNSYQLDNNFFFGNSGNYHGHTGGDNDVILTADPYVNEPSGDLTLNNIEGGGKECRGGVNIRTAFYSKTKSYQDVGGLQAYDK